MENKTPIEKSQELVSKYRMYTEFSSVHASTQCALIAVTEIIKVLEEVCDDRGYDPFEAPLGHLKYYKEVKQELLKDEISKVNKESDECYFEPTLNTSSTTICKHCSREKFLHKT